MATLSNPSEIAREALRLLASRRIPPTPDNYQTLYHEIAGTKPAAGDAFPEKHLRSLAAALPKASPDQMRLARQLDEAVRTADWDDYRNRLVEFIATLAESQKLAWADLINELLRQWEAKQAGITPARKREALDRVLNGAAANPDTLYSRLQGLLRSWAQGKEADMAFDGEVAPEPPAPGAPATPPVASSQAGELLAELRELFAYTLETAISTQLLESPQLSIDAKALAADIRKAASLNQLQDFLTRLKRFAFKLELLAEDQAELRQSLLGLLRLMVENVTELVMEDRWLHGQIEVVREIIDKPLSQRGIDDAQRRLKEVIYKQSQLKQGLQEAKEAIKQMLAGFVDHLAGFADATSDYHDKIEACATRISAADNITDLENVIGEVMRETRSIQLNALRSRDELRLTQQRVRESERRIEELESELEKTSHLVRHDQLTGVLNRRGLEEMAEKEIARARRHESSLCLALLDIDNFKRLNDQYGHDTGDAALVHLARTVRETLRPQDTVSRYGGEEFVIILPESSLDQGITAMTRVQRELTRRFFLHANQKLLITFSAGVAELRPDEALAAITKRADEAMYQAKQSGKNRVVAAT